MAFFTVCRYLISFIADKSLVVGIINVSDKRRTALNSVSNKHNRSSFDLWHLIQHSFVR